MTSPIIEAIKEMHELMKLTGTAVSVINARSDMTPEEKAEAIKKLKGITRKEMMDFVNKYRFTENNKGPTLAENLQDKVSEHRPRGVLGLRGRKKKNG